MSAWSSKHDFFLIRQLFKVDHSLRLRFRCMVVSLLGYHLPQHLSVSMCQCKQKALPVTFLMALYFLSKSSMSAFRLDNEVLYDRGKNTYIWKSNSVQIYSFFYKNLSQSSSYLLSFSIHRFGIQAELRLCQIYSVNYKD